MTPRTLILAGCVLLLLAVPPLTALLGQPYYIDLVRRVMIFGIAAVSLNLILGYGGLVSFGHAAYLGVGGYAVGIFAYYGVHNGWLQWLVAILASALVALAIGAISLRTRGIYFIMITLAFTQMLYYLGVSLEEFGGDDGMAINRSEFVAPIDFWNELQFYYVVLGTLALCLYLCHRIVHSRFGMALQGTRSNSRRMEAIGFATYRYRLVGFAIAGVRTGREGQRPDFHVPPGHLYDRIKPCGHTRYVGTSRIHRQTASGATADWQLSR